jgi:type I restriction enzyme S subunit
MVCEWSESSLDDLVEIEHGFAFKGEYFRDEPPGDILLTPGNFAIGGGFKSDKLRYYDGSVPDEFVLHQGDLIVTMTDLSKESDTLGYPAFVPAPSKGRRYLHNQRLGKVKAKDKAAIDLCYVYYLMCSSAYRHEVLASATGTTVKHTSPERIKRFRFLRPSLPEQHAIANILGRPDDKIELNRKMNETLEAVSQALFKSWFVDFEPFRDQGMEDSPLGPIPKGWMVGILGDIADNQHRGIHPKDIDPSTPYIGLEHIPRKCIALSEWGHAKELESNKFRFKKGEFLFGKLRPYFHKVGVAPLDGVCSTDILVIAPKEPAWFGFALGHVSSTEFVAYTDAGSTGTKMPRTNWQDMARYEVVLPPQPLAESFNEVICPLVDKIIGNIHQSRTLAAIRDTLLPKLLSGEISVRDAESFAETSHR